MKAVIALSGLAGFVLFGVPLLFALRSAPSHVIRIETRVTDRIQGEGQDPCRFEAQRDLTVPVRVGQELRLSHGSGSLEVVGVPGLGEIRAVARACASHENLLDDLRLAFSDEGSAAVLEARYPQSSGWGWGGDRYASLDLRVEVPEGMAGEIRDGSGEMTVSGLGALLIEDGSGELAVEGTTGDLEIRDSSGGVEVRGVQGALWIQDSSGEIHVQDVTGRVDIQDGSGEIYLAGIGGDVEIEDGSGEVEVQGVGGSVTLSDGSGELDIRDVQQAVRVLRDGSGSIDVDGVGGDFIVEVDGGGTISYSNVAGAVSVPKKERHDH